MWETIGPSLRATALTAFIIGLVLLLLNPPSFAGLGGLTPPFAPLALASVLAFVGGAAAGSEGVVVLAAIAIVCLFLYVLRGAALGRMTPWVVMRILLWAPSYCLWKVGVLALAALGGGRGEWKRQRAGVSSVERPLTVD